jgi:proline iminopeptidase
MNEGHIDVPGGKIWYQIHTTHKTADRTPVIILHGGPGVPHNYLLNLSALKTHRPIIFYDQLGCGKSPVQESYKDLWTISRFVTELNLLTQALSIKQFTVMGHSWGGALAVEYALTYPQHVKSLILASPLLSSPLWIKDAKQLIKKLPLSTQNTIIKHEQSGTTDSAEYQEAIALYAKNFLCRMDTQPTDLAYSFAHLNYEIYLTMWGPTEFTVTGNLKDFDPMNNLDALSMPTLITCGRFDEATPKTMQQIQRKTKNAQLVIFENSAHVPHLEEPEEYLQTLAHFLTGQHSPESAT